MAQKGKRANFDDVLKMVREHPEDVFSRHARMLSDLSVEKTAKLRSVLSEMPAESRNRFYSGMHQIFPEFYEYNFAPIAEVGLDDPDGDIRAMSINTLSLEDSREIGDRLLRAAEEDPAETAQIAAINVLGQYMLSEVLEEPIPVPGENLHKVLEKLIEHKTPAVRRAAIVSYAVSETARVNELIRGYLAGNNRDELISALRAVSISMNEDFSQSVLELINHDDEDIMMEAIRAAGVLQLKEALPVLYELLSRFDSISPELLLTTANAVAEIGDESSIDVLETLGEAVVDMDEDITEAIDDSIDTLNMAIQMGPFDEEADAPSKKTSRKAKAMLQEAIERAKDHCLSILEEKIPHDLEDDEPIDFDEEEDDEECDCGEHHHHHHHHYHEHDNPLKGLDLSRFRILDDLEEYETNAHHDADEEELWAEFENMAEEDLDADSLQDFINKLEAKKKKK